MTFSDFIKKYDGHAIEDWHSMPSEDFKKFAGAFKRTLAAELKLAGISVAKFRIGHYDISAFLEKNGDHVYISYNCPRNEIPMDFDRSDPMLGALYREARSDSDYIGGRNHFCSMKDLPKSVIDAFDE